MPGGLDKRTDRFQPVVAEPTGTVHYEERPVPVRARIRITRPFPSQIIYDAWVIAWTTNAVLVFYVEKGEQERPRSLWLSPDDVRRK